MTTARFWLGQDGVGIASAGNLRGIASAGNLRASLRPGTAGASLRPGTAGASSRPGTARCTVRWPGPDGDALRDLARVADRGGRVVRDLQAVPQVRLDRGVDPVQRVGAGRQRGQDPGHVLAHVRDARPHDLLDQVVTGREVVVDGRRLDLRLVGHVAQPRARIPFPAEHVRGGIEDPLPGPRGLGTGVLRRRLLFSRHGSNYRLTVFRAGPPAAPPRPVRPLLAKL